MTKKNLQEWAKYIREEVPYHDNREIVRNAVVEMAKRTMKSFTDKDEQEFLKESRR